MEGRSKENKPVLIRIAQIFSDLFSPPLVPTYGMAIAMWATSLRALPERSRWLATILIAMITCVLPVTFIVALQKMGRVSDNSISSPKQRPLPMLFTMICYIAAAIFLNKVRAPLWLQLFFYGAALATLVALLITFKWKISAHATAVGGLVGMLMWFAVAGLADVNAMAILTIGIVIAGMVCTTRLLLNRHTVGQVLAGSALGFACTFLLTLFFYA